MSKVHICDICENPIKTWEKVKYTEYFTGCSFDYGMVLPVNSKRKIEIEMCPKCHDDFIDYLKACAIARKMNEQEAQENG